MQLEEDACSSAVRGIELAREERAEALRRVAELQAYTYMCMHMHMYIYVCVCVCVCGRAAGDPPKPWR